MNGLLASLCDSRKPALRAIVFAAACLWLGGCASDGLKSYKRGLYLQSCEEAVNKLAGKPKNTNAQTALMGSYPLAQLNTQRMIDNLSPATDLDTYENVIIVCDRMNSIAAGILRVPVARTLIPTPSDYTDPRNAAAAVFVRRAYRAGVRASAVGTLAKSREALDYFTRVIRYSPQYRKVQARIEKARYDATMRVVVTRPESMYPSMYPSLSGSNYFYDKLLYGLPNRNLVRFYTPEEAVRERMFDPHQIVELEFAAYMDGEVRKTINTTELVRNVAIDTTTAADGSKQTILGDVKASYTATRVEMQSAGRVFMRIIDAPSGRVVFDNSYSDTYIWVSETATFSGDKRALDSKQLELTKARAQSQPSEQEMYEAVADLLSRSVSYDIDRFVD